MFNNQEMVWSSSDRHTVYVWLAQHDLRLSCTEPASTCVSARSEDRAHEMETARGISNTTLLGMT